MRDVSICGLVKMGPRICPSVRLSDCLYVLRMYRDTNAQTCTYKSDIMNSALTIQGWFFFQPPSSFSSPCHGSARIPKCESLCWDPEGGYEGRKYYPATRYQVTRYPGTRHHITCYPFPRYYDTCHHVSRSHATRNQVRRWSSTSKDHAWRVTRDGIPIIKPELFSFFLLLRPGRWPACEWDDQPDCSWQDTETLDCQKSLELYSYD